MLYISDIQGFIKNTILSKSNIFQTIFNGVLNLFEIDQYSFQNDFLFLETFIIEKQKFIQYN